MQHTEVMQRKFKMKSDKSPNANRESRYVQWYQQYYAAAQAAQQQQAPPGAPGSAPPPPPSEAPPPPPGAGSAPPPPSGPPGASGYNAVSNNLIERSNVKLNRSQVPPPPGM